MNNITEVTPESYLNILGMANSPDKENQIVALSLIENLDYKKNLVYILVLKKQATMTSEAWKEHAPSIYKKMVSGGVDPDKVISYKKILNLLLDNSTSQEHFDFYTTSFAKHMKESIKNIGYEYVDDLEITIKLKKDDKTGSTGNKISAGTK